MQIIEVNVKDQVLFDIECLERGLPPLSKPDRTIAHMILTMPADKKRKMTRKIRKVTKSEIRRRCAKEISLDRKVKLKKYLEHLCKIGEDDAGEKIRTLMHRIRLARSFVLSSRLIGGS